MSKQTETPNPRSRLPMLVSLRSAMRAHQAQAGQSLMEFALTLPLFLTLFLGIIEFSWAIYGYNSGNHAGNEAARRGMVLNRPKENYAITGNSSGTYTAPTCNASTIA